MKTLTPPTPPTTSVPQGDIRDSFTLQTIDGRELYVIITDYDAVYVRNLWHQVPSVCLGGVILLPTLQQWDAHANSEAFPQHTPVCGRTFTTQRQAARWLATHWDIAQSTIRYIGR